MRAAPRRKNLGAAFFCAKCTAFARDIALRPVFLRAAAANCLCGSARALKKFFCRRPRITLYCGKLPPRIQYMEFIHFNSAYLHKMPL